MNSIAGLPWYIRHAILPTLFGVTALTEGYGWWSLGIAVITFIFMMTLQIMGDGWDREQW